MEYELARDLSRRFYKLLAPVCLRIETVGSIKRADPKALDRGAHDIEILLIPDPAHIAPVFGAGTDQPRNRLERLILDMKADELIAPARKKAEGDKYKKFAIVEHSAEEDFCLELFVVTPQTWAIQNVIRTGPRLFSKRFVTNESIPFYDVETDKRYKGLLPDYYEYVRGETVIRVRHTGQVLDLKEEADAIRLLGLRAGPDHWIPPSERYMYV